MPCQNRHIEVTPIISGLSAADYYGYDTVVGRSSSTPDGIERVSELIADTYADRGYAQLALWLALGDGAEPEQALAILNGRSTTHAA